ncbi:MAG: sigma 54-interacting transcriptional regulator [Deltaproteobacteria bacterium]|nr:sigma 54-interacting transcriptional regulator [Deltaproteobacteria bacterium]
MDEVHLGRGEFRALEEVPGNPGRTLQVRVADKWMSLSHATLSHDSRKWHVKDEGSTNGTLINGVPQASAVLAHGDLLELGETLFLFLELEEDCERILVGGRAADLGLETLVPKLAKQFTALMQLADSDVSVMILGESGTGKELVARAVHALSHRQGQLVAVNCGALPANLVETELLGYRKGAFSGATENRPGLARAADGGTLFLDEIGDLPPASQAAFLRVLQEREVLPVGDTVPVRVNLRLVSATHRDLQSLVEEGEFRSDLLARVSGFTLALPPLRDRRVDLGLIMGSLLKKIAGDRAQRISFSCEAARALFLHDWPLNVRELEKHLATAVALLHGDHVELEHFPSSLLEPRRAGDNRRDQGEKKALSGDDNLRRQELIELLRQHHGNIAAVARLMGKGRMQIHRWLKRFNIDAEKFRDGER